MNSNLISVIIPVFNVEKYINQCLDSVINQTHKKIEVIVIDDGSTDKTPSICDEYAEKDSRITVIHKKNEGQAVARNIGIEMAQGEWLHLLDSDDWIESQMYETLLSIAEQHNCAIVSCGFRRVFPDVSVDNHPDDDTIHVLEQDDVIRDFLYNKYFNYELWNKLFKKELFSGISFVPGQLSEEVHIARLIYFKTPKIAHTTSVFHNYRVLRVGNTASSFKVARICLLDELEELIRDLTDRYKIHLVNYIHAVAAKYAYSLFYSAFITKQDKCILTSLSSTFYQHYKKIAGTQFDSLSFKLFNLSPILFVYILMLKLFILRVLKRPVL